MAGALDKAMTLSSREAVSSQKPPRKTVFVYRHANGHCPNRRPPQKPPKEYFTLKTLNGESYLSHTGTILSALSLPSYQTLQGGGVPGHDLEAPAEGLPRLRRLIGRPPAPPPPDAVEGGWGEGGGEMGGGQMTAPCFR